MKESNSILSDSSDLIAAYLLGTIDREEMKRLIAWIHSSEENKQLFDQFNAIWQAAASEKEFEKADVQKQWEEVLAKIQKKRVHATGHTNTTGFYSLWKKVAGIAVAVAIIFGAGMYLQYIRTPDVDKQDVEYVEMTAPIGSRAHVLLADGSSVWLNAGTTIRYNNRFGKTDRDITLTGEAYFSVAKRPDLPFVIQAADVRITALGTVFNVKAYDEEGRVETSLESGSVKIERVKKNKDTEVNQSPIILRPNEKVSLLAYTQDESAIESKEKKSSVKQDTTHIISVITPETMVEKLEDIRISTSWKDSNWVIRSESMKSLAIKLERRYNVNFIFQDKDLEKYKFSATLRDETLEQVLSMIQISAPIKYSIKEKNVYLSLDPKFKKEFEKTIR